jgi:hypothetical protein
VISFGSDRLGDAVNKSDYSLAERSVRMLFEIMVPADLLTSKIAISLKDAKAKGRSACKACHPPE